jgi:hypothetical protein
MSGGEICHRIFSLTSYLMLLGSSRDNAPIPNLRMLAGLSNVAAMHLERRQLCCAYGEVIE